jgi:predicted porin
MGDLQMQKKILALIVASVATGYASAAADVYGKVNLTYNHFEDKNGTKTGNDYVAKNDYELVSNDSRIGFKADYGITEDLRAIGKLEYEVCVDDGYCDSNGTQTFKARNTYIGVQGTWGTVIAGRNDSLVKMSQGEGKAQVDRFNDLVYGDIKYVMVGENRQDNILIASTSKFAGGFQVAASAMPGENQDINYTSGPNVGTSKDKRHGAVNGYGMSVSYTTDRLYIAGATDQDVTPDGEANPTDLYRLSANLGVTDTIQVGALVQNAEQEYSNVGIAKINKDSPLAYIGSNGYFKDQSAWLLSSQWEFSKGWTAKIQYAESTSNPENNSADEQDVNQIAIGVDYAFDKNARVFAYAANLETPKNNSGNALPNGTAGANAANFNQYKDSKRNTIAVGYEMKF